jgi:hypothetical protein
MVRLLGHRHTKGAATDKPHLRPPRHISTLPIHVYGRRSRRRRAAGGPKRVGDGPEIVSPKRTSVGYGTQPPAWFTVTRTPNARTVATPGQITRAAIPALTYV